MFLPERRKRKPGSALVLRQRIPITNGSSESNRQHLMRRAGRQARQAEQAAQASKHARTLARTHSRTQAGREVSQKNRTFWVRFHCPEDAQNVGTFLEAFLGKPSVPRIAPKIWHIFGKKILVYKEKCDRKCGTLKAG